MPAPNGSKRKRSNARQSLVLEVPEDGTPARAYLDHLVQRQGMLGDFFLDDVHDRRADRFNRIIYIGGDPDWESYSERNTEEPGVEYRMADRFQINLNALCGPREKRPILVIISSCGGNWEEGMQILSDILHSPVPIVTLLKKHARSMTSLIHFAADYSAIQSPAKYMFHRGTFEFSGLDQEMETHDIERRTSIAQMCRMYALRLKESGGKYSRRSLENLLEMVEEQFRRKIDVWLTSHQAVEWGFVDAVFDGGDLKKLMAKAKSINVQRRERLLALLAEPISVEVKISPWKLLERIR